MAESTPGCSPAAAIVRQWWPSCSKIASVESTHRLPPAASAWSTAGHKPRCARRHHAGVGTVSKTQTYSNNRADNAYIPGAVIPGYIIIKPDFPECIDDFGFLWFEDEAVVAGSATWVVAGNAADAIIKESK